MTEASLTPARCDTVRRYFSIGSMGGMSALEDAAAYKAVLPDGLLVEAVTLLRKERAGVGMKVGHEATRAAWDKTPVFHRHAVLVQFLLPVLALITSGSTDTGVQRDGGSWLFRTLLSVQRSGAFGCSALPARRVAVHDHRGCCYRGRGCLRSVRGCMRACGW